LIFNDLQKTLFSSNPTLNTQKHKKKALHLCKASLLWLGNATLFRPTPSSSLVFPFVAV